MEGLGSQFSIKTPDFAFDIESGVFNASNKERSNEVMGFEIVARTKELHQLREFVSEQGSGFLYLRGRRRVGKSTL